MNRRSVLKRLRLVEEKLAAEEETRESAKELTELLRRYEVAMKEFRSTPGYSVEWEHELAKQTVQRMREEGLL